MTQKQRDICTFRTGIAADEVGVTRFTKAMSDKLAQKRSAGRGGWNRAPANAGCSVADLQRLMTDHIKKGDMVDIANFAMMIWNRENPNG